MKQVVVKRMMNNLKVNKINSLKILPDFTVINLYCVAHTEVRQKVKLNEP